MNTVFQNSTNPNAPQLISVSLSNLISSDLNLVFNTPIQAISGDIVISNGIDSHIISITDSSQITISDNHMTVNAKEELHANSDYTLKLQAGVIADKIGNAFTGTGDTNTITFTTKNLTVETIENTQAPKVTSILPSLSNLKLIFNTDIQAINGDIVISNGNDTRIISIADKSQITIFNNIITINVNDVLIANKDYTIHVVAGVIADKGGNAFIGSTAAPPFFFKILSDIPNVPPILVPEPTPTPPDTTPPVAPTITGAALGVITVVISADAVATTTKLFNSSTDITSKFTVSVNGTAITFTPIASQVSYSATNITAKVSDSAGNVSAVSAISLSYSFDNIAPVAIFNAATDDIGTITGNVVSGGVTDDTTLVLSGTNETGSTVAIYNGATLLGTATVTGTTWSYSATVANATTYAFNATETDVTGTVSAATANYSITGDTVAPTAVLNAAADDLGSVIGNVVSGGVTDDTTLVLSGTNEVGSTVVVYDGVTLLGSAIVTGTTWSYSATVANATTYAFNATETDVTGTVSAATTNYSITGDTVAPIASATTASIKNTTDATVESTEIGTAFLVKDSIVVTDVVSITSAANTSWNQAAILIANTPTTITASDLVDGIYQIYTADVAGNLSIEPATNTITIDTTEPIAASSAAIVFISSDKLRITFAEPISTALVIGDISSDNGHTFGTSTLVALNAISGFAGSFDITLIGSDVVSADILSVATTTALDLAGNSNSIAINFIVPVAVTVDEIRINAAAHAGTKVSISDTAALINAGLADVLMANLDIIDSISPNDGNPVLLTLAQFSTGGTITALTTALAVGTIAIDSTSATINDVNALVTNVSKLATNGISGAISLSNSQFGILTTALNTSATLTVTNTSLAATALITMDTKLTPPVNASAVMTITGTATNIAIVAASAGITKALNYVATVSGTTNSVADLNIIDANTIGVITATLTAGTVAEANVLIGTGNAYTIPLTAVAAVASDLITLDAKTTVAVDATLTTELSGSATDILAVYAANTAGTITGLGNEIVTLSDSGSIAATVLNSIDTKTSGLVTATSVTTITGSEADVKTALIAITTGTALSDTGLTNVTINDAITATTLDIVIFANTNATVTLANVPNNVITSANATVTAGKILKIDGSAIVTNTNVLNFNGSLELDGKFSITGGAGSDVITGSADADTLIGGLGNDTITGGLGADAFTGGGENDKFIIAATDSFNTVLDSISDFSAGDILHLAIPVISTIASTSADLSTAVSFASTGADSTFLAADIATAVAAQRVINANFWANAGDTIAITLSGNSVAGSNVTYIVQNQATDSIYNPTVDTVVALLDVMVPSALAHLNSTIHTLSTSKDVITATAGADVVVVNTDVGIGGDSYYSTIALAADGDSITDFAFGIDTIKVIAVKVNTFSHLTNVVIGAGGADYPTNTGLISMNGDTVYNDLGDIALNFITPNTPLSVVNLKAALQYNLTGTAAIDTITGGSLADTIDGGDGADIINAGEGDNYIVGGEGADSIISGTGADIIDGGGGADTIESGAGDDIIFGGGGADSIIAGAGNDTIAGGVEADEYVFSNYATNGLDLITDFTTASDTLSFRFVDTAIAVGGTAVASAAQQAMTNHSVYVAPIAGLAADLTTGSSITLIATDLTATTLTNVAALLGERYSVASNQNAIFILNSTITNASGNAYVYSFHNGSDTTLDAGDLVLIGLLTTAVVAVGDCI